METLTKFDVSEYLDSEEAIAEYLAAVLEENDTDLFLAALADIMKIPLSPFVPQTSTTHEA